MNLDTCLCFYTPTGQNNSKLRDVPKLEKFHKIEKRKRKFGEKHGTGSQMSTKDDNRSIKTPGSERTGTGKGPRRKASFLNHSNSNSGTGSGDVSGSTSGDNCNGLMSSGDPNKLCVEFSHTELFTFFTQLERMQQQLDALGSSS